ncbi:SDR family oxidoreductase [Streptomyces sp. NPDC004539]|uniref:SDR family oxidoreductase n=1 Tax=Streptomyces sp. NPDC004539 TaxID=3154280 RepID=UPI0033BD06B2
MTAALHGRAVLITGAGRGFGRLLADAFADAGARLVLTGRDPAALHDAVIGIKERRPDAHVLAVPADVTRADDMRTAVERAVDAYGTVDVLVNNAGAAGPIGPLWEVDPDDWWHAFTVNVLGMAHACRAVVPVMTAARPVTGRIVNLASEAGRHRWPYASAYSVSKAAVIKLTENLAAELRPHNIPVFAYHPGLLDLGVTHRHLDRHPTGDPWEDRVGDWLLTQRAQGAFTAPDEAVAALLRLAAGQADPLSGHYLTASTTPGP